MDHSWLILVDHMENKSILDTILDDNLKEDAAVLDSQFIINTLFEVLKEKERDVLCQRFGLENKKRETLEAIGGSYNLTRERIRQIENFAVNKLKKHPGFDSRLSSLKNIISRLLEEHGGIVERQYLIDNLSYITLQALSDTKKDIDILKNHFDFILSKLLINEFDSIKNNDHYNDLWKLKYASIDHLEDMLGFLLKKLEELKNILTSREIIDLIKNSDFYAKYKDRLEIGNNFNISEVIKSDKFEEDYDLINEHKALYSLLRLSKNLKQNKFGHWGLSNWPEITPKTINEKIYLVVKNYTKPMHFREIADEINKIGFDHKIANPATVHNELILDSKYVLVGRGIYALKDWGYNTGTVADVVAQVLKEADRPLTRDEIAAGVLAKRLVKKTTINLALMDKNKFAKVEGGKYKLMQQGF